MTGQSTELNKLCECPQQRHFAGAESAIQVVCRDGSGAYGEAVRRALPGAVQAGDRWHLWHSLAEAVLKEVAAHSVCS